MSWTNEERISPIHVFSFFRHWRVKFDEPFHVRIPFIFGEVIVRPGRQAITDLPEFGRNGSQLISKPL